MKASRSLPALVAGAVGFCALALATGAAGPTGSLPFRQARSLAAGPDASPVPLAISERDGKLLPYRLHASTRSVVQAAPDPLISGRYWLATDGGLLRFDSASGQWRRWTLTDGLPEHEVRSVHSEGRQVYVLMRNSAGVFDTDLLRFRSYETRGEGLSPFRGGIRVASAPEAPGLLWWIVESGVLRQDLAGGSWSSFPVPGGQPVRDGLILAGGRIVVLTENEVWELRPEAKEWRRVCDIDGLDRASPTRRDPTRKVILRSISTADGGRTFWIGTQSEGLFRVEAGNGQVTWPEETRDTRCWLQRVVRQGDRLYAYGAGCLREIGRPDCCTIDRERVEEIRQAFPDPGQPDILWLATQRGLASFRPADGHLAVHLPSWPEPDGVRVTALLAAGRRLWISQSDGGVSALGPSEESWTTFPRLRQVRIIRRSAANGHVLVYGHGGRGRVLTWIDPKTAQEVLVPGRWDHDLFGAVGDFHHDVQGLWAVGHLRQKEAQGFGVQRADGTSQLVLEGQLFVGPHSLAPDPVHPGDFLLVGAGQELLRVHAGTGEMETLRSKVREIRPGHPPYLWIQGEPSARLDLKTGALATLDLEGKIFPDPDLRYPDRAWLLRSNVLALYDVVRRERLAEITLPQGLVYDELAFATDRFWVGSSAGLLEISRHLVRRTNRQPDPPQPAPAGDPEASPRSAPAREVPVEATLVDSPSRPFRLHASTRSVLQLAADPRVPGRLWLGTEQGLVRYDTGKGGWRRWTLADGLPEGEVRSLSSDGRRVHLLLPEGLAVFDVEPGRFQSWTLRGAGLPESLQGIRVVRAPDAPKILWWVLPQGLLRQDLAAGKWSFFPAPEISDPPPLIDGAAPGGGRIFVASRTQVWELQPKKMEWRRVSHVQELDRISAERKERHFPLAILALSTEEGGRALWIGTWAAGLFRVDAESGEATWPEKTRDDRCGLQRVVRHRERLLAFGDRQDPCVREIGPAECCALDRNRLRDVRDALPDPRQKDLLWIATDRGLASLRLTGGQLALHRPSWSEPDGGAVEDLLAVEGRLWLSQRNADVSVLDPDTGSWKILPGVFNARKFHRSAVQGRLLTVTGMNELVWIDPRTMETVESWPRSSQWGSLMNLHHDERGLWGQGQLLGRLGNGVVLLRPEGIVRVVREGPFRFAVHSFVPDPVHAGDFLVVWNDSLARLDAETGDLEVLRPGVESIRLAGDRYLWVEGQRKPSARLDLRTGAVAELGLEGRLVPDLRHPDRVWVLQLSSLALHEIVRGEQLAAITLPDGVIIRNVAVLADRLWIGSSAGLLEFPLPP